jgi:hypothetical protein
MQTPTINATKVTQADKFIYFGSEIDLDGKINKDVNIRVENKYKSKYFYAKGIFWNREIQRIAK